ncbi:MAG: hypothetical protein ABI543_12780 [Ignavibacteria bacterium]
MNETRLIETLKTFNKEEWKQFEKFAASPFFNNGRNYLPFIKQLQKFYPSFDSDKLTYEHIHKKLYPGKAFNKQVMWNLASELEKLSREFILQLGFRESRLERFRILFNELLKRKLDKQNLKEIEAAEKFMDAEKTGPEYFYASWTIEESKTEYWNTIKGRQDKALINIVKGVEYFILNMFADISIQVWDLHVLGRMYNSAPGSKTAYGFFKKLDLEKMVIHAEENGYKFAPVLKFYYNKIMAALDEDNEKYFFEMKKFFEASSDLFYIQEQKNIMITLANYCANKMRLGNEFYFKELFEINKMRLERGTDTFSNGRMNKALYHQILRNALGVNEIKWAEDFITEYTPMLNAEFRKPMEALALGYLNFVKKDYRKTLYHINRVEFIDIRDKLHTRILSAKSYYELTETELLLHYIDSSRHFISSNEAIEDETREAYLKFFKYLEKLVLYKGGDKSFALKKLRENIENDKNLRLRHGNWFYEKINELEKAGKYRPHAKPQKRKEKQSTG